MASERTPPSSSASGQATPSSSQATPSSGQAPTTAPPTTPPSPIPFREALAVWIKISLLSFGGPAGQIALMHRLIVEDKKWISNARFMHALNFCMLLPGPEAQQLTIYLGWLMHRVWGGVTAGILFILPGAITVLAVSILYAGFQDIALVEALFFGIKAAVLAIVLQAVWKISQKVLHRPGLMMLAALAFLAVYIFNIPFPLVIFLAGLAGWIIARNNALDTDISAPTTATTATAPSPPRSLKVLAICGGIWLTPVAVMLYVLGPKHVYVQEALFFSQMAMVTFGGAYAVLTYMAQQAVGHYGWLNAGEMLDGLGMAETTPGPLIMVVQFVGFMGAYRNPGMLDPFVAGTLGALITTWVTFAPCFLWIFLGAPYIEHLRGNRHLSAALEGITAAVVGVMLNLALWFGLNVIFLDVITVPLVIGGGENGGVEIGVLTLPVLNSIDWVTAFIASASLLAMMRFKMSMITTLAASAIAGVTYGFVYGG